MFHNIRLPPHLSSLFPLKKSAYGNLAGSAQRAIACKLGFRPSQQNQIRRLQSTLLMGFKWAVYIAHHFLQSCYEEALQSFLASSTIFGVTRPMPLVLRLNECFSAHLSTGFVLIMHIIDDLNFILCDWPESESNRLQRRVEEVIEKNYLPVKISKSSPLGIMEKTSLSFIGWVWDLKRGIFRPKSDKILAAANAVSRIFRGDLQADEVRSAVGRLVWVLLGTRPLQSLLYRTFQFLQNSESTCPALEASLKRELAMSARLSCLSMVRIKRKKWLRIIAFDACDSGGAVVYTDVSEKWFNALAELAFHSVPTSLNQQESSRSPGAKSWKTVLHVFTSSHHWKTAFIHHWRRHQHINALEEHIGVLEVEWAISHGISGHRIILMSDSLVAIGAFRKGRSSSAILCLPCRKFAALVTAHDLDFIFVHVPSEINPADGPSRIKPKAVIS